LGKRHWHSSGFPVGKILFEKFNGSKSFIMFSASGDENKRGITSFILKFGNESINLSKSVVDEINVVSGVDNFLFNKFSVSNSSIIDTSVGVHDGGEVTNSFGESGFSFIMGDIEGSSLIKSRLSKTIKDIHNGINGVTSLFFQLHKLSELR